MQKYPSNITADRILTERMLFHFFKAEVPTKHVVARVFGQQAQAKEQQTEQNSRSVQIKWNK